MKYIAMRFDLGYRSAAVNDPVSPAKSGLHSGWGSWLVRVSATTCMLTSLTFVSAQQAPPDPVVSETTKLLKALRGTWSVTERSDGRKIGRGTETWRAGPGTRSAIEEYHSVDDHGRAFEGYALVWWDDQAKGFRITWCDSDHGCHSHAASWQGNEWIVRDEEFQEVFSAITPRSFLQTVYAGSVGDMKRIMTIEARRVH